ncbi:MAG: peptidase C45 acyl-coenzyme A:6-aminopenicillanic acid acyl-transferase [Candidatus Riflebacteria bacterium]|nr:peptidase C45 acyl-coenzyme A:6-aminopenicillanic acid acyl-transferase [Candidatus Riflebacteria bacterium]
MNRPTVCRKCPLADPGHRATRPFRARPGDPLPVPLAILFLAWLGAFLPGGPAGAGPAEDRLIAACRELLAPLLEDRERFTLDLVASSDPDTPRGDLGSETASGTGEAPDRQPARQPGRLHRLTIHRSGAEAWAVRLSSPWREVFLSRQPELTSLVLPKAGVAFVGEGPLATATDHLAATGLLGRVVTPETSLAGFLAFLGPATLETGLRQVLLPGLTPLPAGDCPVSAHGWRLPGGGSLLVPATDTPWVTLTLASSTRGLAGLTSFTLSARPPDAPPPAPPVVPVRTEKVSRADLERMLFRGLFRALSVKFPGAPVQARPEPRKVPHGDLRHHDGQILVRLAGSPVQIGTAHGQLLGPEIRRTVDSTLHLVGLVSTIERGKWFPGELEEAWSRLSPHLPPHHLEELQAIASACPGLGWRDLRLSSIFPEYFHCSGFALFGRATADGALYHGRVLDYMTEIGLQQVAVAFVVKPDGARGFLNAGYAGLQGSVSGMNEAGISLGEMGGGGRYQWDGVPMTTLMRRALEECGTLEEVRRLWADSPRTCEYYYVFADGKIPDAMAVRATPTEIEFLRPGHAHPQLGEGIADAVVLSAGSRLKELRHRVTAGHGTFTASSALRLMDRPVAMRSNLHNCLFVPARGEAWIANADDRRPAAECPYVRYDLRELLRDLPR